MLTVSIKGEVLTMRYHCNACPGIKGEVLTVSCGFKHTSAVTRAGALFTWGDGKEGKLVLLNPPPRIWV